MKALKTFLFLTVILFSFTTVKADSHALNIALNDVTKCYMGIKNALAANNATDAANKANDMIRALNAVPDKDMTAPQHTMWLNYINKLQFDSRHISESNPVDHKREHFAELSNNLFTVLKTFKPNSATLYRQYCPMKKTYWLSETAAIKNPYYGPGEMATCGVTKEEIKPAK